LAKEDSMTTSALTRDLPLRELETVAPDLARRAGLNAARAEALNDSYGYRTLGLYLQGIVTAGPGVDLKAELGLSRDEAMALVRDALRLLPKEESSALQLRTSPGLGLRQRERAMDWPALVEARAPTLVLPDEASVEHQLSCEIVDQGNRGTCGPCAAKVANHALQKAKGRSVDLSAQHLYYECKERDEYEGPGTYIDVIALVLDVVGQCLEATWPYNPSNIPGNEGQGPPPPGVEREAREYRCGAPYFVRGDNVNDLRMLLAGFELDGQRVEGRPVVMGVLVYPSMMGGETARTGVITMPLDGEQVLGGHAMVLTSYEVGDGPGGGWFGGRNSWGLDWGRENPDGPGHFHLPFAYMANESVCEAFVLISEEDVELVRAAGVSLLPARSREQAGWELGKDWASGEPVRAELAEGVRHVHIAGNTGSGKSTALRLCTQEAVLHGLPALVFDNQHDMCALADLAGPPVGGEQPVRAEAWRRWCERVEPVVFTPMSDAGIPLCASPFNTEPRADLGGPGAARLAGRRADTLVAHLDTASPAARRRMRAALCLALCSGDGVRAPTSIPELKALLDELPAALKERFDEILSPADLVALRRAVACLLTPAGHYLLDYGVPPDLDLMLGLGRHAGPKTRLAVVQLAALESRHDRELVQAVVLEELYQWMLAQGPVVNGRARVAVVLDELELIAPDRAQRKPLCKDVVVRLAQQGRKYGVWLLTATQSPGACDYRVVGQANTLLAGCLRVKNDVAPIARLLEDRRASEADLSALGNLRPGQFFLTSSGQEGVRRLGVHLPLCPERSYTEEQLSALVPPETRARFAPWLVQDEAAAAHWGVGASGVASKAASVPAAGQPTVPGPPAAPSSSRPSRESAAALLDDALLEVLADASRALSLPELARALQGAPQPVPLRPPDLLASVERLMGSGLVLSAAGGRRRLFYLRGRGFKEDQGLLELVLHPGQPCLSESKARRALQRLARAQGGAGLNEVRAFSLPVWRAQVSLERSVLWGLGTRTLERTVLMDAVGGRELVRSGAGLGFRELLDLSATQDVLSPAGLCPQGPAHLPVLPANYRHAVRGRRVVSARLTALGAARVVRVELAFLPAWAGVLRPYTSRARSLLVVDALWGEPLELAELPDLRSLCLSRA
jgi:hypothetical protein